MEKPKPSTVAWIGLAAGVAAYDIFCPEGETLSEGVDRALETRYKHITAVAVGAVALHLVNKLPNAIDPLHQLTRLKSLRKDRE